MACHGAGAVKAVVLRSSCTYPREAKTRSKRSITTSGIGPPRREFLRVDDVADAVALVLEPYSSEVHPSLGTGHDISILDVAPLLGEVVGWEGEYELDRSEPDGVMCKTLNITGCWNLAGEQGIGLRKGIEMTTPAMSVAVIDLIRDE